MSSKPLIGINVDVQDASRNVASFSYVANGYIECIRAAGAIPLLLPPSDDDDAHHRYLDIVNGLVFIGGKDLDPRNDGFMLHPSVVPMSALREVSDRRLMNCVIEQRVPVFAIGAGMQLLNVAFGGNLSLHIPEDYPQSRNIHYDPQDLQHRHSIDVVPGSLVHSVYGDAEIRVASRHHMCVDEVAPGFEVTARSPDGLIEAIESAMPDWFALGVQWHPESAAASAIDQLLFERFVEAVLAVEETQATCLPMQSVKSAAMVG